jgi:hypothetical protein
MDAFLDLCKPVVASVTVGMSGLGLWRTFN